jgi:hypothetical protein
LPQAPEVPAVAVERPVLEPEWERVSELESAVAEEDWD